MQTIQATNVRSNFSAIVDTVVRDKPVMVKRNRDLVMFLSQPQVLDLVKHCTFKASYLNEKDGSITATLEGFDLVVNAGDAETINVELAKSLLEYAEEYFEEFQLYYSSTNRKQHFAYVLRVLLSNDLNEVQGLIHA